MLIRLLRYARPHRTRILLATLCSILNKVFDLAPPLLIGMAVDIAVKGRDSFLSGFGYPEPMDQIWLLAGLTVVIWGLESAFQYCAAVLWRNLAQRIQHDLRVDAYGHVQDLEMAYFEDKSTGGLMSILNDDINQLERFLDVGANEVLQVATTVVVIGAIFFGLAPLVACLAMLPMPFVLLGSIKFTRAMAPRYAAVRSQVGHLNATLANNLGGVAVIKSYTAEAHERARVAAASDEYVRRNRHAIRLSSAFTPLIRIVILCGFTGTLVLGGKQALDGALEVGAYSVMIFLTQRLLWPLTRLGETIDLYQRAMASTERVLDLVDTPARIKSGSRQLEQVRGAVRFEDVSFTYPTGGPVLRDVSLDIPPGQTIAVVGATGSGKTTLVKLLLRFYEVSAGRILLDDVDIRELTLESHRRAIGLVSQDVFLFHGTVRENIAYGARDASADEIVAAARLAEAHDFVERLPRGYDTVVGERGQKLSGGQRQRISLARALLKQPAILVLDEATSSVDNETEAAIQRSLERMAHERTMLVIAHRLSTVRHADRIHVLADGVLEEAGTHEELLARQGTYAALWNVQTGKVVYS
ncbi:MAG: ABC transporter ATP-binding protein [Planctomycetota bacterium]